MRKGFIALLALAMVFCVCGCQQEEKPPIVVNSDLGSFLVARQSFQETYGDMSAGEGSLLYVIALSANQPIDESKYHACFMPEDEAQVTRVAVDDTEYLCQITALQGPADGDTVEYALVFSVPETAKKAKVITLKVQNYNAVTLKDVNAK